MNKQNYIILIILILFFSSFGKMLIESKFDFNLFNKPFSAFFYYISLILIVAYPLSGIAKIINKSSSFIENLFWGTLSIALLFLFTSEASNYRVYSGLHKLNNISFYIYFLFIILTTLIYSYYQKNRPKSLP